MDDFRKMDKFHQSHVRYACWVTTGLAGLAPMPSFKGCLHMGVPG